MDAAAQPFRFRREKATCNECKTRLFNEAVRRIEAAGLHKTAALVKKEIEKLAHLEGNTDPNVKMTRKAVQNRLDKLSTSE